MNCFIVEDSRTIRHLLVRRVEDLAGAHVVGEAQDEAQAITLIDWIRPDLVLLDLHLADGGLGLNVLRQLRRQHFAGRIFVMSHQSLDAYRQHCLGAGADGFYDKGTEVDRLFDDLAALIEGPPAAHSDDRAVEALRQVLDAAEDDAHDLAICVINTEDALPEDRLGVVELAPDQRCIVLCADIARPGSALFPAEAIGARALLNLARARAAGLLESR